MKRFLLAFVSSAVCGKEEAGQKFLQHQSLLPPWPHMPHAWESQMVQKHSETKQRDWSEIVRGEGSFAAANAGGPSQHSEGWVMSAPFQAEKFADDFVSALTPKEDTN